MYGLSSLQDWDDDEYPEDEKVIAEEVILKIREEIIETAIDRVFNEVLRHCDSQYFLYCLKSAWRRVFNWMYLEKAEEDEGGWGEQSEPEPASTDPFLSGLMRSVPRFAEVAEEKPESDDQPELDLASFLPPAPEASMRKKRPKKKKKEEKLEPQEEMLGIPVGMRYSFSTGFRPSLAFGRKTSRARMSMARSSRWASKGSAHERRAGTEQKLKYFQGYLQPSSFPQRLLSGLLKVRGGLFMPKNPFTDFQNVKKHVVVDIKDPPPDEILYP